MFYIVHGRAPEEAESEGWTNIYPVLAIQTIDFDGYMKHGTDTVLPITHDEAENNGWTYTGREQRTGVVVVDDEYGVISTNDSLMYPNENEVTDIVVLSGSPDEAKDNEEISACIRKLVKRLAHKFSEQKSNERKT